MARIGRPRGTGARFVRICFRKQGSNYLYIGRALWHELGSPPRVQIRRQRPQHPTLAYLVPCAAPLGYAVQQARCPGLGMPRISIGQSRTLELGLLPGRFAARLDQTAIVFDLAKPVEVQRATPK